MCVVIDMAVVRLPVVNNNHQCRDCRRGCRGIRWPWSYAGIVDGGLWMAL